MRFKECLGRMRRWTTKHTKEGTRDDKEIGEKNSTYHRHTAIEQVERHVPRKGRQEARDEGLPNDTEGAAACLRLVAVPP